MLELYLKHGIKPIIDFDFFPENFAKPFGYNINAGSVIKPKLLAENWQNQFQNHEFESAEMQSDEIGVLKLDYHLFRSSMKLVVVTEK